jgi:hypothetical protein
VGTSRANAFDQAVGDYEAALDVHDAAQATARMRTDEKDAAKDLAVSQAREVAQIVQSNPAVTDAQRAAMGITVRDQSKTPVPPPSAVPAVIPEPTGTLVQQVKVVDAADPFRRSKPAGVAAWQVFVFVGEAAPLDVSACRLADQTSRNKATISFTPADAGKKAWILARAVNAKGEAGPAGEAVAVSVAA